MYPNVMELLLIIKQHEIKEKGIPYVRSIVGHDVEEGSEDSKKWDAFWKYFTSFWMSSKEVIATWNIVLEDSDKDYHDLQNRTNNGLESYNRRMTELFSSHHPSLLTFVQVVEEEARKKSDRMDDIRSGGDVPPLYSGARIREIPYM